MTLAETVQTFLLSREAAGCTVATLRTYAWALQHFVRAGGAQTLDQLTPGVVEGYLAALRSRLKPVSAHRHYRVLRTFCRWAVRSGRLDTDPLAGLTMRVPKTLPRVPSDEELRRLLAACTNTFAGRRNRALIALAADSGLRRDELRQLRIADLDLNPRTIRVWSGKGQKDGTGFFGETTASLVRAWLSAHPDPRPVAFLFATCEGVQLGPSAITRILHRISARAGLERKVGPHALRHFAATALLRKTGDLDLVRRVLRHSTLDQAMKYTLIVQTETAAKFQQAAPLDQLWSRAALTRHYTLKARVGA